VLFAAYVATIGVGGYAEEERHFLVAAASLADGGVDLSDEYVAGSERRSEGGSAAGRRDSSESPFPAATDGRVVAGRLVEPHGIGFPLLIAPAYALGGDGLVVVLLAAVAALAFVLGARLARLVVPDPWATWAALLAGLSPPALAAATAVLPAMTAGALLAGAALCALAVRERPLMRYAYGGGAMLALLPWLDPWLLVPAAPVAALLARWTARRGRGVVALGTLEVQLASLVFYVSLNERLYGGFTPLAAGDDDTRPYELELLPWAPVLALALVGTWLLWRSRRERLGRVLAEQRDVEHAAFVCLVVCAATAAVAVVVPGFGVVAALPCAVAPIAWGFRRAPRTGWALGALTVVASVWLALTGWT
jgi:hypothetical protein